MDDPEDLCKLLARITVHKTFRQIAFHKRAKRDADAETGETQEVLLTRLASGPTPEEAVAFVDHMETFLGQLKPTDRQIIEMRMEGYNNLPQKTAEVMHDGWYRSGDIMRRDEHGFYYYLGRADDMFVVGGENVWPGEVERLIERMPGVHQATVVPVSDEIKGTLPFAFVVRQSGASVTEAEIKAFAIANGPAYAHPRLVEFRDEIPLAATAKPDRKRMTMEAEAIARARRSADGAD